MKTRNLFFAVLITACILAGAPASASCGGYYGAKPCTPTCYSQESCAAEESYRQRPLEIQPWPGNATEQMNEDSQYWQRRQYEESGKQRCVWDSFLQAWVC